ncbi:MAG: hypothetical protein N4A47_06900 [Clostridia bacterium]|nr:hypothetical protein [Clostridia bacterium]
MTKRETRLGLLKAASTSGELNRVMNRLKKDVTLEESILYLNKLEDPLAVLDGINRVIDKSSYINQKSKDEYYKIYKSKFKNANINLKEAMCFEKIFIEKDNELANMDRMKKIHEIEKSEDNENVTNIYFELSKLSETGFVFSSRKYVYTLELNTLKELYKLDLNTLGYKTVIREEIMKRYLNGAIQNNGYTVNDIKTITREFGITGVDEHNMIKATIESKDTAEMMVETLNLKEYEVTDEIIYAVVSNIEERKEGPEALVLLECFIGEDRVMHAKDRVDLCLDYVETDYAENLYDMVIINSSKEVNKELN